MKLTTLVALILMVGVVEGQEREFILHDITYKQVKKDTASLLLELDIYNRYDQWFDFLDEVIKKDSSVIQLMDKYGISYFNGCKRFGYEGYVPKKGIDWDKLDKDMDKAIKKVKKELRK